MSARARAGAYFLTAFVNPSLASTGAAGATLARPAPSNTFAHSFPTHTLPPRGGYLLGVLDHIASKQTYAVRHGR